MPIDMPPVSAMEAQLSPPVRMSITTPTSSGQVVSSKLQANKHLTGARVAIDFAIYRRISGSLFGLRINRTRRTITARRNYTAATISAVACRGITPGRSVRMWAAATATVYQGRRYIGTWKATGYPATFRCTARR